jgi:dipeptidyl aminopeptidase/acylaminoacyl peptidase
MSQAAAKSIVGGGLLYTRARYSLNLNEASPLAAIEHSRTPTLLIHGLMDQNTPPEHSSRLADAGRRSATLWLVPAAGHTGASSTAPAEFRKRVFAWFSEHN